MAYKINGETPALGNNYPVKPQKMNMQEIGKKGDMPAVFGVKDNGDGIVNKEDFSDQGLFDIAQEKGLIGKTWDSLIGNEFKALDKLMRKPNEAAYKQKYNQVLQNTMDGLEQGTMGATVQFGHKHPILRVNTNPVMNVQLDGDKVILTPIKNGQQGNQIEMTKEEFMQKCMDETPVIKSFNL